MKNMIIRSCLIAVVITMGLTFAPVRGAQRESKNAAAVVESFYKSHFSRRMDFGARSVAEKRSWFAPELYRLLLRELQREREFVRAHPDEVPHFNGDPFTGSQEPPGTFRVGKSTGARQSAEVEVMFFWDERSSRGKDERKVVVRLRRQGNRWLVANFVYEDGKDLVSDLRRVEY